MQQLNRITEELVPYLVGKVQCTRALCEAAANKNYKQYIDLCNLLTSVFYEYDFHLFNSISEIENCYKKLRNSNSTAILNNVGVYEDDSEYVIDQNAFRYLLEIANKIYSLCANEDEYGVLLTELVTLLQLHSRVDPTFSFYEDGILAGKNLWRIDLLLNNPWLVACIVIKQLPEQFLLGILTDTIHQVSTDEEEQ